MANYNENEQNPQTAREYYARAAKRYNDGDFDGAIADYNEVLRIDPNHINSLLYRGNALYKKRKYDEAIEDYSGIIWLEPNNHIAWYNRGNARNEKREYEQALSDLNESIRLNPNYANAWNSRGNAWYGKEKYDEALSNFNEAIRLMPGDAYFWLNRGNSWHAKREYDKAIEDYKHAILLKPDYALAFSNRGNSWSAKGEYDKAIEDCREALGLNPGDIRTQHIMDISQRKKDERGKDKNDDARLTPEEQESIRDQVIARAIQASELERKAITEDIKREYSEKLGKELESAVEKVVQDTTEFRENYKSNLRYSRILRVLGIISLATIVVWMVVSFLFIHYHFLGSGTLGNWGLIAWIPVVTVISMPFVVIWWMLQRWSFELKTLAYGFQRKAILEERILLFFRNDPERLKEMQKLYVVHWMEKSPLEVMLAINGKSKNVTRENSSASALLKEMLDSINKIIDKDDTPLSS